MTKAAAQRPELLVPAGSADAVRAAVLNGADAVYMAGSDYNARRNAKNLTEPELIEAMAFCRIRDVKTYITINTLLSDRELTDMVKYAKRLSEAGADAFITADLGVADVLRHTVPNVPLHASTQMTIHSLEGVRAAQEAGFSRVILARELCGQDVAAICKNTDMEIEVFVHGALCMCWSGQCFMSSLIGRRSGNRGLCAQPCRLPYAFENEERLSYPLSLKDLSMAGSLGELARMGVKSLKIEGRMKRPEYVAAVCGVYARALREGREPKPAEMEMLRKIFSRDGFTDAYFKGDKGPHMFGVRAEPAPGGETEKLYAAQRATYAPAKDTENIRVNMHMQARPGFPARLCVHDADNRSVCVEGEIPSPARTRAQTAEEITAALSKTGGTPFAPGQITADCSPELYLPASGINAMRREALKQLELRRACPPQRKTESFSAAETIPNRTDKPDFTISALRFEQITEAVLELAPRRIYLPAELLAEQPEKTKALAERFPVVMIVPQIVTRKELPEAVSIMERAARAGASGFLVGNAGMLDPAGRFGLPLYGDTGLNVFNSYTLRRLKESGLQSAVLSFELALPMIRDIAKCMDTEAIVYGRLPLLICENCVLKNAGRCGSCKKGAFLTDRSGARFPVVREFGCRNRILNAHTLFVADKLADFEKLGLWALRLCFTVEPPKACDTVACAYLERRMPEQAQITRGLYYRGVQ